MKQKKFFIQAVIKRRGAVMALIFAFALIIFGLHLLSNELQFTLAQYTFVPASLGFVLLLLGWAWVVKTLTAAARITLRFEGVLSYDKHHNDLIDVAGYRFHEFAFQTLHGTMLEQSSLQADWQKDPLSGTFTHHEKTGAYQKCETLSGQVLAELVEYWALMSLGQHLHAYYSPEDYDRQGYLELTRAEIDEGLLQNRFLKLFTQSWADRGDLRNIKAALKRLPQVSLLVPLMSKIRRIKNNVFVIETPTYRLQVEAVCPGYTVRMPHLFVPLYLGHGNAKDVQHFQMGLKATVNFNGSALLTQGGWEDYAWVMSWLDLLEQDFSKVVFLNQIEWQRTMAVARVLHNATELKVFKNVVSPDV
jgi:hypothetical protein